MGIITDAFGKLFSLIWDVVKWLFGGIANIFKTLFDILADFFTMLFELLKNFFEAIFAIIQGLLHFLYMIGVLAVKLFQVIFEAAKILWSLVVGFGKTLASLSYSPSGGGGNGYSGTIGKLFNALEPMQLDPIAYILLFCLWFITAVSAMKLLSSIRVGGD